MSALHIFDMDGTLLRGSACVDISYRLGYRSAVDEMESKWALGLLGQGEYYEQLLPLWAGLTGTTVEEVFIAAQWIPGIPEVWADIATRGETSVVITLSPQFFADRLLRWGATAVYGAAVEPGVLPEPEHVLTPECKIDVTCELLHRLELTSQQCVAYGDSDADIPLFDVLPNTVAVNGTEGLKRAAAAIYDGWNLGAAYAAGRRLLDQSHARHDL